jgi:hypothetical protein
VASLLLSIGALDVSAHIRTQPGDGLEATSGDNLKQLFAGTPALAEGTVFVGESVDNKQIAAPLFLRGSGTADSAIALLSQLKAACVAGASVQFRPEGASNISYFTLQSADIKPKYDHFRLRAGWLEVALTLYVSPFASTGTARVVASAVASNMGAISIASLGGDAMAQGNMTMTLPIDPSKLIVVAYGVAKSPSFMPLWPAASLSNISGTLIATSNPVATKYIAAPLNGGGFNRAGDLALSPRDAYLGRHRLFGIMRTQATDLHFYRRSYDSPVAITTSALVDLGAAPTYVVSPTKWSIVDLGEISIPSAPDPPPLAGLDLRVTTAASLAGLPLQVAGLFLQPLDIAAGIVAGASSALGGATAVLEIDGIPPTRKYWANAANGSYFGNVEPNHRGVPPAFLPATTQQLAVLAGDATDFQAAALPISVKATERFQFLR